MRQLNGYYTISATYDESSRRLRKPTSNVIREQTYFKMIARRSVSRLLSEQSKRRGFSIGRMIDMGGMPSASSDNTYIRTIDASKNSKLQAVAFDFEALTNSIDESNKDTASNAIKDASLPGNSSKSSTSSNAAKPDIEMIQQVASLLNIDVPGASSSTFSATRETARKTLPKAQPHEDIRAKYARKLQGGLAGVELAKSQVEETLARGDAAGHIAARKLTIETTAASPTKWMAMTGTGALLSYLTYRSIKIALLPNPRTSDTEQKEQQHSSMEGLKRQLKDVVIDCAVRLDDINDLQKSLKKNLLDPINVHPNAILVVTDRDDYLQAAKELGMLTCRIQKPNARRGNITAHFNTKSVPDVKEVVNEINGISFNAVLNR